MANWNEPNVTTDYITVLQELKDRDVDAVTLSETPANQPTGYIRLNRTTNIFQTWNGSGWVDIIIGVTGGGTGATNPSINLGTMASQNNNAVNITGGTITGVSLSAASISGIIPLASGGTGSSLTLGPIGHVLASDGNAVGFQTGINIPQLNANALIAGNVPVARLGLLFASGNTWTGGNTFNSSVVIAIPSGVFNVHVNTLSARAETYIDLGQAGVTPDVYVRGVKTHVGYAGSTEVTVESTLISLYGTTVQHGNFSFLNNATIDSGYLFINGAQGGIINNGADRVPIRQDVNQAQFISANNNTYMLVLNGGPANVFGISGEGGAAPLKGKRMVIVNAGADTDLVSQAGSGNFYGFYYRGGAVPFGLASGVSIELYCDPPYWFPLSR